jgi:hypothetical protein
MWKIIDIYENRRSSMEKMISDNIKTNNKLNLSSVKDISLKYSPEKKNYSLKDQLEQLTGYVDTSKLEEVNIVIGIVVSILLLVYFIL